MILLALLTGCGGPADPQPASGDDCTDTGGTMIDSVPIGETGDTAVETGDTAPPSRTDADGDGHYREVDDCDDARADVYPGATEWCDPIDHDCDGEALAAGVCAADQEVRVLAAGSWVGLETYDSVGEPRFVGDLDGDGTDDFTMIGGDASALPDGEAFATMYYVPGGMVPAWETSAFDAANAIWRSNSTWTGTRAVVGAGDFDGDGAPDLWLVTQGGPGWNGAAFLMRGPPSRWPYGGDIAEASDAAWYQASGGDGFVIDASEVAAGMDLDGDDLSDLAVGREGYGYVPAVHVIPGRTDVSATWTWVEDEPWIELGEGGALHAVTSVGDLDGDGLADLAVGQDEVVTIIPGSAVVDLDSADVADLRIGALMEGVDGEREISGFGFRVAAPGDWTGDGTPDLVIASSTDDATFDQGGIAVFVDGAEAIASADHDLWAASPGWWEGAWSNAHAGSEISSLQDVDGDGVADLGGLIGAEECCDDGVVVIPSTFGPPAPGATWGEDMLAIFGSDDPWLGGRVSAGDLDGDDFTDFVFGSGRWNDDRGQAYVVRGWDLPWYDPTWW